MFIEVDKVNYIRFVDGLLSNALFKKNEKSNVSIVWTPEKASIECEIMKVLVLEC